jgi:hypothetical protein
MPDRTGICVNSTAKRSILGSCGGVTSNIQCTTRILYPSATATALTTAPTTDTATYTAKIESINLVAWNSLMSDDVLTPLPYVYEITFNNISSSSWAGWSHYTISLTDTSDNTNTENFVVNYYNYNNNNNNNTLTSILTIATSPQTTSSITTTQTTTVSSVTNDQYWTINPGTYTIVGINYNVATGITNTYTFPSYITFGDVTNATTQPTQTITIN